MAPETAASKTNGPFEEGPFEQKAAHAKTWTAFRYGHGGHDWDRTSDPCDVNTVLYR